MPDLSFAERRKRRQKRYRVVYQDQFQRIDYVDAASVDDVVHVWERCRNGLYAARCWLRTAARFVHRLPACAAAYRMVEEAWRFLETHEPTPDRVAWVSTMMGAASWMMSQHVSRALPHHPLFKAWFALEYERAYRKRSYKLVLYGKVDASDSCEYLDYPRGSDDAGGESS